MSIFKKIYKIKPTIGTIQIKFKKVHIKKCNYLLQLAPPTKAKRILVNYNKNLAN